MEYQCLQHEYQTMPTSEIPKLLPHTAKSHRKQGLSSLIMGSFTALPQDFHRESL